MSWGLYVQFFQSIFKVFHLIDECYVRSNAEFKVQRYLCWIWVQNFKSKSKSSSNQTQIVYSEPESQQNN